MGLLTWEETLMCGAPHICKALTNTSLEWSTNQDISPCHSQLRLLPARVYHCIRRQSITCPYNPPLEGFRTSWNRAAATADLVRSRRQCKMEQTNIRAACPVLADAGRQHIPCLQSEARPIVSNPGIRWIGSRRYCWARSMF